MAKKSILFPVDKFNGSIPHYLNFDKENGEYKIEQIQNELDSINNKSRPSYYATDDQWRDHLLSMLREITRYEWKEANPFLTTLKIVGYSKGRSAANFDLEAVNNKSTTYTVFMVDIIDLITKNTLVNGEITGYWLPIKRGANYGIKFLGKTI